MRKELIILSGFLGSGKTTLLQRLLRRFQGRKVAVLLNDFGEIPVDGALLADNDVLRMVEIGGGSIFCACLKGAFVQALMELGKTDAELVLVEASGMSDPAGVTRMLNLARLDELFAPPRVICLFDPVKSLKLARVLEVIPRQVRAADVVLLTKPDLTTADERAAARAYVRDIAAEVTVNDCNDADLDLVLTGLTIASNHGLGMGLSSFNTPETRPDSFVLQRAPAGRALLLQALTNAPEVLRVKGYLEDAEGRVFVSDTGKGFMQQSATDEQLHIPLTVICLQGQGAALQERLCTQRLAE